MAKNLILGFLPWFIYFAGAGYGNEGLEIGIIGAIISIFIFNFKAIKRKDILDLCTVVFFIFLLIVGVFLKHPWFVKNAYWFSTLMLTLIIFLTIIIKKPFTMTYAKESVPQEFWDGELFIKSNYYISTAWLICMAVMTIVSYAFTGAMSYISQAVAMTLTVLFSIYFPDWYTKRVLGKNGVAQINGISKVKHLSKIGYRELGSGKTVVLLHGTNMNMHHWDPIMLSELAKKYRCVIIDLPGICFSKQNEELGAIEEIGDFLKPFVKQISDDKIILLGYSLGAFVAQYIATEQPDKIEKLVLISANYGGETSLMPTNETVEKLLDQSGTTEERMIRLGSLMFTSGKIAKEIGEKIGDIYTSAAAETMLTPQEIDYLNRLAEEWYEGLGIKAGLKNLALETTIISGDSDLIVPNKNSDLLKAVIKNSTVKIFPNSGHGVIYQYPKEIAELV